MTPAELRGRLPMDPAAAELRLAVSHPDECAAALPHSSRRHPSVESPPGEFQRFQLEAVAFWCGTETIVRSAHDDVVLASLG